MLLLLFAGATTGQTPTPVRRVGWIGRRHKPEDLERRLKEQSDATFSRKWFNELLEAQDALVAKAAKAKTEAQRKTLEEAAETAWQVAERAEETLYTPPELDRLVQAFNAALHQERATAMMKRLHEAIRIGRELEDDEEAIELLVLY